MLEYVGRIKNFLASTNVQDWVVQFVRFRCVMNVITCITMRENFTEGNCVFRELMNYVTSQCFTLLMYVSMICVGGGAGSRHFAHIAKRNRVGKQKF